MALESLGLLTSQMETILSNNAWMIYVIIAVLIWKLIWYGLALYRTIEKKQKAWFVVLFICTFVLNDLGILAIIYLIINTEKKQKISIRKKG